MGRSGGNGGVVPIAIKKHSKRWYEGPQFKYRLDYSDRTKDVFVDVTRSAPHSGLPLSAHVTKALDSIMDGAGGCVLDFGAGAWLRHATMIKEKMNECPLELYIVEYEEAFRNRSREAQKQVAKLRDSISSFATFWTPKEFASISKRGTDFDLILLINVLNTIPEERHRGRIFRTLVRRLRPSGRLVVDQRIWVRSENPEAPRYGDGWIIEQPNYCTFRAGTGATWFNNMANRARLNVLGLGIKHSSGNTFFRIWEKPFGGGG